MSSETSGTPLVEIKDLSIAFGGIKAVDQASVDLFPGEVVAILGHNGAGKSTLIKVLSVRTSAMEDRFLSTVKRQISTTPGMQSNMASRRSTKRWPWPIMWMLRQTSI